MLRFAIILIFLSVSAKVAGLSMMLVWGQPVDTSDCTTSNITNFTTCYSECLNRSDCVVAFMNESNPRCILCAFQTVDDVLKTSYADNLKTAIKINSSTCPSSVTDEGQILQGCSQTTALRTSSYQIMYTNETWEITYNVMKYCPAGWKRFERQMGLWCIASFYNATGNYNQTDAQSECEKQDATLTGVENMDELNYINGSIKNISSRYVYWLGAKLRPECVPPNWNTTICNNTLTYFEWTDGFTTGTDGFAWAKTFPYPPIDTYNMLTGCLVIGTMFMSGSATYDNMANTWCSFATSYGYACGKQPGI